MPQDDLWLYIAGSLARNLLIIGAVANLWIFVGKMQSYKVFRRRITLTLQVSGEKDKGTTGGRNCNLNANLFRLFLLKMQK